MKLRLTTLLAAVLIVTGLSLVGAGSAFACSCKPLKLNERTFERYDAAIVGKVVKRKHQGYRTAEYRLRVAKKFTGPKKFAPGDKITVRSAGHSAACGLMLRKGARAGLFLYRQNGAWWGNSCLAAPAKAMRKAAKRNGYSRVLSACPKRVAAEQSRI